MYGGQPLPGDYHIHPDFSFDASGSVDDFCRAALNRGLTEICFTTHYDADPIIPERHRNMKIGGEVVPVNIENMKAYVDAVHEAHERYYEMGLMVKCGIEVGYYDSCFDEISRLFRTYDFVHKIGSVHIVDGIDICNDASMQKAPDKFSLEKFADLCFEELVKSAECGLFDVLGHIDMYKKFAHKYYGEKVREIHRGRIDRLFEAVKKNNIGIEVNTSALRRGHTEYYPSMEIINLARNAGVRILSIGSDAHRPEEVGYDFEAASAAIYELTPYCDE